MARRDGLRAGDIHVPGSRRYADPISFLLTAEQWEPRGRTSAASSGNRCVQPMRWRKLTRSCTPRWRIDKQLATDEVGHVRLGDDGELIIPRLPAEDVPAEVEMLRDELAATLPHLPIAAALVELDARTGFNDHLVHAGGKVARSPELKRNLFYVLIAESTNMGVGCDSRIRWLGPPNGTSVPRRWLRRTPRSSTTTTGCRTRRRSGPAPCRPRTGSGSR